MKPFGAKNSIAVMWDIHEQCWEEEPTTKKKDDIQQSEHSMCAKDPPQENVEKLAVTFVSFASTIVVETRCRNSVRHPVRVVVVLPSGTMRNEDVQLATGIGQAAKHKTVEQAETIFSFPPDRTTLEISVSLMMMVMMMLFFWFALPQHQYQIQ